MKINLVQFHLCKYARWRANVSSLKRVNVSSTPLQPDGNNLFVLLFVCVIVRRAVFAVLNVI